jgi:hypothetical protein
MTLPAERFAAIARTRTLMQALCDPKRTPGVPKPIREDASRCLKHYPTAHDLDEALYGLRLAAQVFAAVEPIPRKMRRPQQEPDE